MKFVPKQLEKTRDISRGDTSLRSFLKNSLSVALVLLLLYVLLGWTADYLASSLPEEWEAEYFGWATDSIASEGDLPADVREVFERLARDPQLRPLPYHLFIVDSGLPNAFALPGGGVGVTSGLIERDLSTIGLAMVIGHELGHHQRRHTLKRTGRGLLYSCAEAALFGGSNDVVGGALQLAASSYSRDQEREADEFGLRLVHRVYGSSDGALEFFQLLLDDVEREQDSPWREMMSSHPSTPERIANLKRIASEIDPGE